MIQIWLNGMGGPGLGMARQLQEQYVLGKWEGKLQQEVLLATSDPHEMDRSRTRTETKEQEK